MKIVKKVLLSPKEVAKLDNLISAMFNTCNLLDCNADCDNCPFFPVVLSIREVAHNLETVMEDKTVCAREG